MKKTEMFVDINTIMIFIVFFSFLCIISYKVGYNSGEYNGMNYICDKDLLIDEEGNIFCDEIKTYEDTNLQNELNFTWDDIK